MLPDTPLLQLRAATLRRGRQHFGPFQLQLQAGERVAILGPSGAGKSTLLRLLAGDSPAEQGSAMLQGRCLRQFPQARLSRLRAVLPQRSELAFGLEVALVVALGRVACPADSSLRQIVRQALDLAHAGHLLRRRTDTLSGGELARVQLARIFAQMWDCENGLILVDEPLAALDPGLQLLLLQQLRVFAASRGHALVAILHDINHALLGFDRLWLVHAGRLQADLPSNIAAVPQLEALYGVQLETLRAADGQWLVVPRAPAGSAACV